jgi:hypothetical protein
MLPCTCTHKHQQRKLTCIVGHMRKFWPPSHSADSSDLRSAHTKQQQLSKLHNNAHAYRSAAACGDCARIVLPSPEKSVNVLSIQIMNCSRLSGAPVGLPGMPATLVAALLFALRAPTLRALCAVPLPPCGGHKADGLQPLPPARPCSTSSGMLPANAAAVPGGLGQADVGLLALPCSAVLRPTLLREMGGNTTLGRSTAAADSAESKDADSTCVFAVAATSPSPGCVDSCGRVAASAGDAHRLGCCNAVGDAARPGERPGEPPAAAVSLLASSAVDVSAGSGDTGPSSTLSSAAVPASSALYMWVLLSGWLACMYSAAELTQCICIKVHS